MSKTLNRFEVIGIFDGKEYVFKTFKSLSSAKKFIDNHCDETLFLAVHDEY